MFEGFLDFCQWGVVVVEAINPIVQLALTSSDTKGYLFYFIMSNMLDKMSEGVKTSTR